MGSGHDHLTDAIRDALQAEIRRSLTGQTFAGRAEGVEWSVTITHSDDITVDLDVEIPEPPTVVRVRLG